MANVPINWPVRIKGANLTTKPGVEMEETYWMEWDWHGWLKPQIDYALALGCNAIRLIGDVAMVINGHITQSTYNQRLAHILRYCADQGIGYYYTGTATYGTDGTDNGFVAAYNAGHQAFADVIISNIDYVCGGAGGDFTDTIIGIDIVQEWESWNSVPGVADLYGKIKPNVPAALGCTFSLAVPTDGSGTGSVSAYLDFLDAHVYPQVLGIGGMLTPSWVQSNLIASYPSKDLLFGEGGANYGQNPSGTTTGHTSYSLTQVSNWYNDLSTLGKMTDAQIAGAMMWAVQDQNDLYGAYDGTWARRSHIGGVWRAASFAGAVPMRIAPKLGRRRALRLFR